MKHLISCTLVALASFIVGFALSGCSSSSGSQGAPPPGAIVPYSTGGAVTPTNFIRFKIETRRLEAVRRGARQVRPGVVFSPLVIKRNFSGGTNVGAISCDVLQAGSLHISATSSSPYGSESIGMDLSNFPFGVYGAKLGRTDGPTAFQGQVLNQNGLIGFAAAPNGICNFRLSYVPNGLAGHVSGSFSCDGIVAVTRPGEVAKATGSFTCDITAH